MIAYVYDRLRIEKDETWLYFTVLPSLPSDSKSLVR